MARSSLRWCRAIPVWPTPRRSGRARCSSRRKPNGRSAQALRPNWLRSSSALLQRVGDLGDSSIGADLILVAAPGAGHARAADHFVAGLDRNAAADADHTRNLLQECEGGIFHLLL